MTHVAIAVYLVHSILRKKKIMLPKTFITSVIRNKIWTNPINIGNVKC